MSELIDKTERELKLAPIKYEGRAFIANREGQEYIIVAASDVILASIYARHGGTIDLEKCVTVIVGKEAK